MEISFNIFKAGLFKVNSFIFIIFLTNDVCPNLEQILLEGQEHHQWKQDQENHITFTNFYKLAACLYLHNITGQLLLQKIFFIQCLLYMKSNLPFGNAREKMYPFFLPNLQVGGDDLFLYIFLNGMPPRAKKRIMMDCSQHLNSITNEM